MEREEIDREREQGVNQPSLNVSPSYRDALQIA